MSFYLEYQKELSNIKALLSNAFEFNLFFLTNNTIHSIRLKLERIILVALAAEIQTHLSQN
jgi:hypothetical protein